MNINFQIERISQNIKHHGTEFTFKSFKLDEFNEPTKDYDEIQIKGLFHQSKSYVSSQTTNGTISRSKPKPMILTLIDEISSSIQMNDIVKYHGNTYKVIESNDLNNLGIALDISLEMIDNGA